METTLHISSLLVGYQQKRNKPYVVAGPVDAKTVPGQLISLIGPNGSGKSTLLRTLSSIQRKLGGQIMLCGQDIGKFSRKMMATKMSVVLTESLSDVNLSVESVVALGRHPYSGLLGGLSRADRIAVDMAMQSVGIAEFRHRKMHALSDGETQKVLIARALAQDTPLLLLDEPTAHLDIANRLEIIHLLQDLARKTKKTVIQSTHELDLALRYSDRLWILDHGDNFWSGVPEDLVFAGIIERVFGNTGLRFDASSGAFIAVQQGDKSISLSGDTTTVFWTKRALERNGYHVVTGRTLEHHIESSTDHGGRVWKIKQKDGAEEYRTVAALLADLNRNIAD
jgi:iron complex transport system ATP-binding protein